MQRPDSRIVTAAALPLVTSYPKKKLVLGLSVLLGLGLGCVLAFLVDFLDQRVKTVSQLEDMSRLPSLAAIPLIGPRELARRAKRGRAELEHLHRENTGMLPPALQPPLLRYAIEEPGSIFAEQIRTIRVAMHQAGRDKRVSVVMVASSVPGEGKSTVASNLALAFATLGVETVLVDADLRNPQLTLGLCPRAERGVFDVALGHATLDDALVFDEATGLAVLPSPSRRYDAAYADFTSASGMQIVLDQLRQRFSLIIVDTPPLAALVDGRVLAAQADRILFVAAWNRTPTEVVRRGLDLLAPVYDRVLGTVLTQVDLDELQHYDYYRSSAHLRSYPYYYQQQQGRERAA